MPGQGSLEYRPDCVDHRLWGGIWEVAPRGVRNTGKTVASGSYLGERLVSTMGRATGVRIVHK